MISNLRTKECVRVNQPVPFDGLTCPLNELAIGDIARVIEIHGGKNMTRRLMGLGLKVGSKVMVLHRRGEGVVVGEGGNRIAIGGGVANRVMMQLLDKSVSGEGDG